MAGFGSSWYCHCQFLYEKVIAESIKHLVNNFLKCVYENDGHQENWTKWELGRHISKLEPLL